MMLNEYDLYIILGTIILVIFLITCGSKIINWFKGE